MEKRQVYALKQSLDSIVEPLQSSPDDPINYALRPSSTFTRGLLPAAIEVPAITSPLTEMSRVEVAFVVDAGGTVYVPQSITMKDANDIEFIFNYSLPTIV